MSRLLICQTKTLSSAPGILPTMDHASISRLAQTLTHLESLTIDYPCQTDGNMLAPLAQRCRELKLLSLQADVNFQTFVELPTTFAELRELSVRTFQVSPEISSNHRLDWQCRRVGDVLRVKAPRLHLFDQTGQVTKLHEQFLDKVAPSKFDPTSTLMEQPGVTAQRDILRGLTWAPFSRQS